MSVSKPAPIPRSPDEVAAGKRRREEMIGAMAENGIDPTALGRIMAEIIQHPRISPKERLHAVGVAVDLLGIRPPKASSVKITSEQRQLRLTLGDGHVSEKLLDATVSERREFLNGGGNGRDESIGQLRGHDRVGPDGEDYSSRFRPTFGDPEDGEDVAGDVRDVGRDG